MLLFQFEIIINVLVSSFRFIFVHGMDLRAILIFYSVSARIDFQTLTSLTSIDVIF